MIYGEDVMDEEDEMGEMDDEKALLALENNKQMADWIKQMKRIKRVCGQDVYERVLFDAALGRNLAAFSVIGDPVNHLKPFVDRNYTEVARHWGGGYPRVLPEVLLKTYVKPEGAPVEMPTQRRNVKSKMPKQKAPGPAKYSPKKKRQKDLYDNSSDEELPPPTQNYMADRFKARNHESDTVAPYTENEIDDLSDSDYRADDRALRELAKDADEKIQKKKEPQKYGYKLQDMVVPAPRTPITPISASQQQPPRGQATYAPQRASASPEVDRYRTQRY